MERKLIVEIDSGDPAECSRRILQAFKSGNLQGLQRELARASRVCQHAAVPGIREEQAELLESIVESIQASISGHQTCGEAEISLLGHLAA